MRDRWHSGRLLVGPTCFTNMQPKALFRTNYASHHSHPCLVLPEKLLPAAPIKQANPALQAKLKRPYQRAPLRRKCWLHEESTPM